MPIDQPPAIPQVAMERRYTIAEIDALRHCVQNKYLWGSYKPVFSDGQGMSRSYREDEMAKVVEEQVRTNMLAGLTAKDLCGE